MYSLKRSNKPQMDKYGRIGKIRQSSCEGELIEDTSEKELQQALTLKQQQEKDKVETNKSPIRKFKDKVISLDTLINYGTYRFKIPLKNHAVRRFVDRFFVENGFGSYDFETVIKSSKRFAKAEGQRVAVVEGVLFFMLKTEGDALKSESTTVYCPIWQRDKAKEILQRYLCSYRPRGKFIAVGNKYQPEDVDKALATQEQFVRPKVYNYLDNVFKRMCENKEWYLANNKRFKETILLHGLPGTGKTSLYMHFGAKYNLNIAIVSPYGFVTELRDLLRDANEDERAPLLVIIEDIDACEDLILKEFKTKSHGNAPLLAENEFNYSKFINALDGAHPLNNMIVCLSTNFKEKLIPSVTRRGRVDHDIHLSPLNSIEISEFVRTEQSPYIASLPDNTFSISNIADLRHCKTVEEINELANWLKEDAVF